MLLFRTRIKSSLLAFYLFDKTVALLLEISIEILTENYRNKTGLHMLPVILPQHQ
jgi:hypothetical protein